MSEITGRRGTNMSLGTAPPKSEVDLFTDEALLEPYDLHRELREVGSVVHLRKHNVYAITRYETLREVSLNWEVFSSAQGVGLNDGFNEMTAGTLISSDPPDHRLMRKVLQRPLLPNRLQGIEPFLRQEGARIVDQLIARPTFDAATDLARHLPLTVVSKLVGLGNYGQDQMLDWAAAGFDALGPMNQRTAAALGKAQEMVEFAMTEARPGVIDPDGWAAALFDAAHNGELPADKCPFMIIDYAAPSLDTTILGTGSAVWLFAQHPDQWDLLREDPSLVRHAINEVLRCESPIQCFTRLLTRDHVLDGFSLPAGARVMLLYGSANRDERKYPRPHVFDITRKPSDHVAFGTGEHACAGMNLARLEIKTLLDLLIPRVSRFEVLSSERLVNNLLRGFSKLEVRVEVEGVR
ncbi:cytochrome P450 (plasmid) [Mycolicibacterium psychrotolerans]|uniref:cytochrome P450 n=1 Tax=Mycolicibacterium psychrotolerans TaxID=216929 RepID=UPI003D66B0EE